VPNANIYGGKRAAAEDEKKENLHWLILQKKRGKWNGPLNSEQPIEAKCSKGLVVFAGGTTEVSKLKGGESKGRHCSRNSLGNDFFAGLDLASSIRQDGRKVIYPEFGKEKSRGDSIGIEKTNGPRRHASEIRKKDPHQGILT